MGKRKLAAIERRSKKARDVSESILLEGSFKCDQEFESEGDYESYEMQPRTLEFEHDKMLPIKKDGFIKHVARPQVKEKSEDDVDRESESSDGEIDEKPEANDTAHEEPEMTPTQKLTAVKEEIAQMASELMENPEENYSKLSKLRVMASSEDFVSSQLAILALVPVFKSLAPAYKIRPLSESELRERVSKEVASLRRYEQALVTNYQSYIQHLSTLSKILFLNTENKKNSLRHAIQLGEISSMAACELCLSSLRYFNYREDLFLIPIRRLNKRPTNPRDIAVFTKCLRTLETLLKDDREHGAISCELTRIMCKAIKVKKFRVDESVINIFLSLSLLNDYSPHARTDGSEMKVKKANKVHLSKSQKKARKAIKEIEKETRQAELTLTAKEREKYQAETLKEVLKLYLEILKEAAVHGEGQSAAENLTAAVMEGLSKFGQMSNFDLLGDFLEVLRELMDEICKKHSLQPELVGRERADSDGGLYETEEIRKVLLCISAGLTLVLHHGEVGKLRISFDMSKFISRLYTVLVDVSISADLEFSHKSLRLADPLNDAEFLRPAVNVSTNAELVLKCLDLIFFKARSGLILRAISFSKRLYVCTLQTPEKTTIAILKFIAKLGNRYGDGLKSIWSTEEKLTSEESYVLGYERNDLEVVYEQSNVESAVLWENVLLDKHYCNLIKDGSRALLKASKAAG